jgi:hypothetical protein
LPSTPPTITERWSGDVVGQQSPDAKNYTLTADRILDVFVDDPQNWNSFLIAQWLSDPVIRGDYSVAGVDIDSFLKCSNHSVTKVAPNRYVVKASYLTSSQLGQSPLNNPPSISFGQITYEEPCDQDVNGNPVTTVNGEPFDPPVLVQYFDVTIRVTRNVATYDDGWAQNFRNTVNSTTWNGYPPGVVKLVSLTGESVLDSDFQYWKVSAEFQIRNPPPGKSSQYAWYRRIMAVGYYVKSGAQIVRVLDGRGQPMAVPAAHDTTTGAQLAPGAPIQWYYFQVFPTTDFNQLGLV